jgi:HSP20 family molecular chaperone IbpA
MARVPAFTSPLLLGFDEMAAALAKAGRPGDGYPPYNIERLPATAERGEVLRITLAVAGFSTEDLEVMAEDGRLVIRGRQQAEEAGRTYLHRGIAARQFQKVFVLAEGIEILGADLKDGLLSVDLFRPKPDRVGRRIEIAGRR